MTPVPEDLKPYKVSYERGFLPRCAPNKRLSSGFDMIECIAEELPSLLAARSFSTSRQRHRPVLDVSNLPQREQERAFMLCSFLGSGWVHEKHAENIAAQSIPDWIAVPLCELALRLDRPPILAYASYALHNWRIIDPGKPLGLDNMALMQHFLGGLDEEWFTLIHVEMEAKAGPGIMSAVRAQRAVSLGDTAHVKHYLQLLHYSLEDVNATFARMPERCDPYIYYNRVRPWIHGWHNQPLLPNGVVYEGVDRFKGQPQKFRGETGAQSSILPLLDAALGVVHEPDPMMSVHLAEMPMYMPVAHRKLIKAASGWPAMRPYVVAHPELKDAFNSCIDGIYAFSMMHLKYAAMYIFNQAQKAAGTNQTAVGTGGTPFMPSLQKHAKERLAARVE